MKTDDSQLKDFFRAAVMGDKRRVKSFLKLNGREAINLRAEGGRTALSFAAGQGNKSLVRWLLKHGADPDIANDEGRTPLHIAAANAQLGIFKYLADHGADVYARDKKGWTVTHHAASRENLGVLKEIFKRGAVLDDRAHDFKTPLHLCAVSMRHHDVARFLIDLGADVNAVDRGGQTPLHLAIKAELPEITKWLLERGAALDKPDINGKTPLSLYNGKNTSK